jgi:hypothetical protein
VPFRRPLCDGDNLLATVGLKILYDTTDGMEGDKVEKITGNNPGEAWQVVP